MGRGSGLAQKRGLYILVQGSPRSKLRHCWWGRSAYLARVGLKSQSVPARISQNSIWLVTSRHDMTWHVRCVEPMHFGRVELVEQHGSTHSTRRARLAWQARHIRARQAWLATLFVE